MSQPAQRLCPVCGVAFRANEAVLRCTGCHALHHPACWVERNGCSTPGEHEGEPRPLAFRAGGAPAPAATRPVVMRAPVRQGGRAATRRSPDIGVLGSAPREPGRLLRYWYVPAGLLLAAAIALGIVWGVEQFGGGDSAPAATPAPTPTPAATPAPPRTPVPTPVPTPTATPTPPPPRFAAGESAVVAGTDSCLNIRASARIDAAVLECVDDGTEVTVLEGPVEANDFTWWRVAAPGGQGWAAGIYLETPPAR